MTDNIEIVQRAAIGSSTTQIGSQTNNYGLSVVDATKMAFEIFNQYYPQLRQEALASIEAIVGEELNKHPVEEIIAPKAKNVLPILQNASITEEDNLREMYGHLLARSMMSTTEAAVHPSYVEVINQMSSFDALVFKRIVEISDSIPLAHIRFEFDTRYLTSILPHYFCPLLFDLGDCFEISRSIENLDRLKLVNLFEGSVNSYDYKQIQNHEYILHKFEYAVQQNPNRNLNISMSKYVIQRNDYGKKFAEVCL